MKAKHFYIDEKSDTYHTGFDGFRIYVDINKILKYNVLILYFELYDEYTKYGGTIKSKIWEDGRAYGDVITPSAAGYEGGQYYHIAGIHDYALDREEGDNLYNKLVNIFERNLFKKDGIVERSTLLLKEELNKTTS